MLKALGVAQSSLKINLEETTFYLRPNPEPELTPTEDVVVKGTLVLTLPKPKRIKSISVKVVAHYNIMFPTFVYETSEVSLVEVQLQSPKDEKLYEKGEHRFSFALIVPSSSATYDRSAHGKIRHSVKAVAFSEGLTGGSNIDARTPIYLIANPAPDGETSDLNVRVEGFKEELGPYAMAIAAQHLTVGGLLHFEALLASVPIRTQIVSVSATLVANYTLRSVQQPSQAPQFAAKRTQLFVFDAQHPPCPETHMLVGDSEGSIAPTGPPAAGTSLRPVESSHSTSGDPSAGSESGDRSGALSPSISRGSSIRAPVESSTHSQSASTLSMASGSGSTRLPSNSPTISRLHHPSTTPAFNARSKGKEPLLPMTTIEPGGSYQVTHLARLPNDDIIRPSTLEGTKTPIETKHELILEIHFNSVGEDGQPGKLMVLRTEHAITLSSCCCMISSLLVPAYSEELSTIAKSHTLWNDRCLSRCICMSSKEELINEYRVADERNAHRSSRQHAGRVTTVVSWDDLSGPKFEYNPVERAQG